MVTLVYNDVKTVKFYNMSNIVSRKNRAKLKAEVHLRFDSDMTCVEIGKLYGLSTPTVKRVFVAAYGEQAFIERKRRLYQLSRLGDKNPAYGVPNRKNKRCSDHKGYYTVPTPKWMDKRYYRSFEHQVVWLAFQGLTKLPVGYAIHHIDCNPSNNAISNLVLIAIGEHTKLHAALRRCNDYPAREYLQVQGSASTLRQREYEIVCSIR
jgi:hypothetical protein